MLDIPLLGIRREKQDGSGLLSNLNRRSNFEDFLVGHPEKSLLKMSDSLDALTPSYVKSPVSRAHTQTARALLGF